MPARFVNIDRDTPLLLPPNLKDWVPANHLCLFIVDAVEELALHQVKVNERGTGSEQYPPRMLLSLLIYSYATGVFGSRRIEQSTYESVAVRVLCADAHPDQDTICTFQRENKELVSEAFVKVLEMAQNLKFLKVGQITVAVDGTKVLANASKHSAVSYQGAGELIEQLERELFSLEFLENRRRRFSYEQAGVEAPQRLTRIWKRKTHPTCRKSDGLLGLHRTEPTPRRPRH